MEQEGHTKTSSSSSILRLERNKRRQDGLMNQPAGGGIQNCGPHLEMAWLSVLRVPSTPHLLGGACITPHFRDEETEAHGHMARLAWTGSLSHRSLQAQANRRAELLAPRLDFMSQTVAPPKTGTPHHIPTGNLSLPLTRLWPPPAPVLHTPLGPRLPTLPALNSGSRPQPRPPHRELSRG